MPDQPSTVVPDPDPDQIARFWTLARSKARLNPLPGYFGPTTAEVLVPPAWSFGATPEQADELLELVLSGAKTATASALWDYQAAEEPVPARGSLGIVLDGRAQPRALVETTETRVVPFELVDEAHARAEGEGDGSLAYWRETHRRHFTEHSGSGRGFTPDMPVVLERLKLVHPRPPRRKVG